MNPENIRQRLLNPASDADIRFDDLRKLLIYLGFEERIKGSHHIFKRSGIQVRINLQQDNGKAKPYQVKQVRQIILKYRL